MEKEFRKIIEGVKQIKLSHEEKKEMRESLKLFIEHNPVREEAISRPQLQQRSFFYQLRLRPMPVFAVVTVLVLVSGGTSLAAESALPGDFLYPVKVNLNEKVQGAVAISTESEAKLAARLAERRLEEAAELAARGGLTAEAQAEIESRLEGHIARFEKQAVKLAGEGKATTAAEISSSLEASLNAHGQVIASTETEGEGKAVVQTKPLLTAIQVTLGTVQKTRVGAEAQVSASAKADVRPAAEGKLKAATNKIAEVRGVIERTESSVSASTTAEAEARLRLAEEAVAEGRAKLEAEAFAEAFMSFDRAHRLAQEAKLLVTSAEKLKVNIGIGAPSATSSAGASGEVKSEGKVRLDLGL